MLIVGLESIGSVMGKFPAARKAMGRWINLTADARWQSIMDARKTSPHADLIRGTTLTCFNIGGGKFRLLAAIDYARQIIDVRELLTHAEYDRKY
jgi:mRNA interferase HigB